MVALHGNPSAHDIAAIVVALTLAKSSSSGQPKPTTTVEADDPWGTPELILRRHLSAVSTLPRVTAPPTNPNPEGSPR